MGSKSIEKRRSDVSSFLIHWTNDKAFWKIVFSGFLAPSFSLKLKGDQGQERCVPTIWGDYPVTCFTEQPVGCLLESSIADSGRYKRWGIAIPKESLHGYGARPVLYGDESLLDMLDKAEKYRYSKYAPYSIPDWKHEREWRVRANVEYNEKVGLKGKVPLEIVENGKVLPIENWESSRSVPLHLDYGYEKDRPKFVLLVETEKHRENLIYLQNGKVPPCKALKRMLSERYSPIAEYWERYWNAFEKATVVSFDCVKDARDRKHLWCLEDIISPPRKTEDKIATWWDKARTETRRAVLKLVGENEKWRYEYRRWGDLPGCPSVALITGLKGIRQRITENKQAVEMLKADVEDWAMEILGVGSLTW